MANLNFETERLILKPMNIEDAEFLLELINTPKWIQNIGDRKVHTVAEAKQYIETKMLPQLKKLGYSNYVMIRQIDDKKVGTCGLYNREGLEGVDIGFALLPQFEKQGYAFEGATKMMDLAKNTFNLTQVSAITIKENKGSQKLIEKLGLQFQKTIKIPNDNANLLLYVLKFKNTNNKSLQTNV